MKLIHLSDLHLGKRVNEFPMLEDQRYILREILKITDEEKPDGVIIAGDVYDKAVPSAEAVEVFDDFLCALAARRLEVFVISGNHDSPERIAFGGRLMENSGVHLSPVYGGMIEPVEMMDEHGLVCVYLLPFVKPLHVRPWWEEEIASYTDALEAAVNLMEVDWEKRNVLVTHQFVTGAVRSESEELSVGGADNVDASVFEGFDYVALGHIHGPQQAGSPTIRYCGSPLKYSFSEAKHQKSVTVVELGAKGHTQIRTVPLTPLHDMRELRGTYMELTARSAYEGTRTDDYVHITLTDEEDIPDAVGRLRVIYPNLMKLDYDNRRTRAGFSPETGEREKQKTPLEWFQEFFEKQNNRSMSEEQARFAREMIESIWEDEV